MKNDELKYISYDEALVVYSKTVAASGGGLQGVKDEGGIRKVLEFVQNDLYYSTFVDKLTYLVFGLCTGHYFEDSNKRVALTIGVWFLVHNGYYWHAYNFMQCMEAIIYHVAAGRIVKASSPVTWQTRTIPRTSNSKSSTQSIIKELTLLNKLYHE